MIPNGSFTRTGLATSSDTVRPIFRIEAVLDPVATAQQGRNIYRDEERVELIFPGDPWKKPVFKVTDEHRQRWPQEYKAFIEGRDMAVNGTPIEMWPVLSRSQVEELKFLGFKSVEDVGGMNDLACQRMMGGMRLRELAQGYLDDAKAQAMTTSLAAENEKKDAQIAALTRQVEELGKMVGTLHSDLQERRNAPSEISTVIPGMLDPIEQAKMAQAAGVATAAPAASALENLPAPRKRGKVKTSA